MCERLLPALFFFPRDSRLETRIKQWYLSCSISEVFRSVLLSLSVRFSDSGSFFRAWCAHCFSLYFIATLFSQDQREENLESFRDGVYTVLVATDVASRGLDIPDVKVRKKRK